MKTICFSREELSILLYALIASKGMIDPSEHSKIDHLIETLNK
jgi:hypothetical protein